jgi:hypothetical protein
LIGTGNGVNKIFTYNLNMAVNKPSVVVYTTIGGNEARGYDDGNLGVITGTQFDTSSINYTTGAVSIIFLTAPDNNAGVYVEYLDDSVTL